MATLTPAPAQSQPLGLNAAPSQVRREIWLGLILLGHLLLGALYSVIIPPWEAHDEWAHYRYAAYIAETLSLPDPDERLTTEFKFDEASQPPLYYLLAAIPLLAVDTADGYAPIPNPYAPRGTGEGGVNFVLHDTDREAWPWSGTILALHLGRFISVLISTAGLFVTYALVRLLSPRAPDVALLAVGIQAFAPQYIFIGAVMTNDILLIVLETMFLYFCVRMLLEGPSIKLTFGAGLLAGLALLTKYLALALLPLAAIAFVGGAWLHRNDQGQKPRTMRSAILMLAVVILFAGALSGRNWRLTGTLIPRDPVSQTALLSSLSQSEILNLDWTIIPSALEYGFQTYWVSFGWGNLGAADWVYSVWLLLALGGVAGMILWLRSATRRELSPLIVVIPYLFAVISLPLLRELLHDSGFLRGRYILSTLPIAAWIIAQGWTQITGRIWPWLRAGLVVWPAALTLALIPWLIIPAYAPPTMAVEMQATPSHPLNARFGETAELASADIGAVQLASPGLGLPITLTWRVLERTAEPYTLAIHLVGAGGLSYGSVTTYPGHGNAATTVWEPGAIFEQTYWLRVTEGGPLPAHGHLNISLFKKGEKKEYLTIFDPQDNPIGQSLNFGSLRIDHQESAPYPALEHQTGRRLARFGDLLALAETKLPELPQKPGWATPVLLRWQALGKGDDNIKLSVQLLDQEGEWVLGSDGSPSDDLPPHLWRVSDHLHVIRWLELPDDLPSGEYTVIAALYTAGDLARLPAFDDLGHPLPADAWIVGTITVQ